MNSAYDCIVIGGGPAGSAAATLLAQAGWHTLLVERERLPRYHVGESLMPETYWSFERLGVLDQLKNSTFIKKTGVRFISPAENGSHWFGFREHDPRDCATTWQVERAEFDRLLFDNARAQGVDCCEQTRVSEVLLQQQRACGVRLQRADESAREVSARVVVDASGQHTLLASQLQLRNQNSQSKKVAIWGYYRNAFREDGEDAGATVILQTSNRKSWFWFIPLQNNITSIGVVGEQSYLDQGRSEPAAVFEDQLVACPALTERLIHAELNSELRAMKQFSYCISQRAGEGWVLIGDAAGFADPIYSSGVMLALKSAELAAEAINGGLRRNDLSPQQLGSWTGAYDQGIRWLRQLGALFSSPDFSLGRFLRDHPQFRGGLTDLLMGRAFQPQAGRVFQALELMTPG